MSAGRFASAQGSPSPALTPQAIQSIAAQAQGAGGASLTPAQIQQAVEGLSPAQVQQIMQQAGGAPTGGGDTAAIPEAPGGNGPGATGSGTPDTAPDAGSEPPTEPTIEPQGGTSRYSSLEQIYRRNYASPLAAGLTQFGYDFFRTGSTQPSRLAVPDESYILGPGDRLRIRVWGAGLDAEFTGAIDKNGNINVPKIGIVPLAGSRFGDAEEIIRREAEKYVQGINIHVSLAELRSIEIYVVGEVNRPGLHLVPPFSTVLGGLANAGGVKKSGSLRRIQLVRNGATAAVLDLYDLLLRGDKKNDLLLSDRDIVFVPPIGPTAAVVGAVARPAIYELAGEKTIADLVRLAGGKLPQAFGDRVYLRRYADNREFVVHDIAAGEDPDALAGITVMNGDLVELQYLGAVWPEVVRLEGHVWFPDVFAWRPGLKLSDILTGPELLRPGAVTAYALLARYDVPSAEYRVEKFPLAAVLAGTFDKDLAPHDKIIVLDRKKILEPVKLYRSVYRPEYVRLDGYVWFPDVYPFVEGMRLSDILTGPELLKPEAETDSALLYRYDRQTTDYQVLRIPLADLLAHRFDMPLQPFDRIHILSRKELGKKEPVRIGGAVWRQGEFPWRPGLTVGDLLALAGGLRFGADRSRIDLSRQTIEDAEVVTTHYRIDADRDKDFALQPYDYLFVRQVKDATSFNQVTIEGEVRFPGVYRIKKGERLADLIERAGGFTDEAYFYGVQFFSTTAKQIQQQSLNQLIDDLEIRAETVLADQMQTTTQQDADALAAGQSALRRLVERLRKIEATGRVAIHVADLESLRQSDQNLVLENGDRLVVPRRPEFVSVVGSVYTPNSFLYQPQLTVADYLARAGGPTRDADEKHIYVLKANGEVAARTQQGMFASSFFTMRLMPGDTVVVPEKLERIPYLIITRDIADILFKIATTAGVALSL